jgi:hypothetical protein
MVLVDGAFDSRLKEVLVVGRNLVARKIRYLSTALRMK